MHKDLEIWRFAADQLARNESVMLLVVAESSGSSPGRQGFKMVVAADEICGSVGGGVMEMRLVELAKLTIDDSRLTAESRIIEQIHRQNSPGSSGMICSGRQTIIFLELDSAHLKIVSEIVRALENRRNCRLRIANRELRIGESAAHATDFSFTRKVENAFVYEEKLGFKNKLIIVGGGHCALALSELMSKLDFQISLFDDRADLNTLAKNEFADEKIIVESYENVGELIDSGANVYVVVMTVGFAFDEIVIRALFDKQFKYFGVLGSRAKMKTLLKNLENSGFAKEKLARLHTPIGLPVKSRTPWEIAVSIAAQIIRVKNGE